jgi:integrase
MATIRKKGNKWQAMIRRKGWPCQSASFRTKFEAESWSRDIESKMDRGHFLDQSHARTTTFANLIEIYLDEVTSKRPREKSRVSESSRLKRFMREEAKICALTMDILSVDHFEAYRDRRLGEYSPSKKIINGNRATISPSTVKRELTTLKRVVDHKKRKLGLLINPVNTEDVKRPAVNDERDVRLTPEEKKRLLEACYNMRNRLIGPFVEFGFETGARRGNLLRLEWCDVDLKNRTALLRGLKNSQNPSKIINHEIGLTPKSVEILSRIKTTGDQIFPMTANAFRLSFNRARKIANLEYFRFHDTRHERISSLFEAGWTMIQVMAQTGHRDPKSVKRYANIQAGFLADQLAKL